MDKTFLLQEVRDFEMREKCRPKQNLTLDSKTIAFFLGREYMGQDSEESTDEEEGDSTDDEGLAHMGIVFRGYFRCGFTDYIGSDCTTYPKPSKGKCLTCIKVGEA